MSLRTQVVQDVKRILNATKDFGRSLALIAPDDTETTVVGFTGDISTVIDPETGAIVPGKHIHVDVALDDLPAGPRPEVSDDDTTKPWRVRFANIVSGVDGTYAVQMSIPNDNMGTLVLILGNYTSL